ncbi:MAG: hypothetical protein GTN76_11335 [Candidatus Aenigmarchaeota archaeon]|nr:hypothetical protein [Candidatus Aenigmarchaeota archaeon]NIQ18021.1 hypothetical protein [Candidatus Aenigmarchaeota archaeon]
MKESVMRDLRGARNLLRAYVRNKDYLNVKRTIKDIENYIGGFEGREKSMVMDKFATMMDEFLTPGEVMFKSMKEYALIGNEQNEKLVKKRLNNYLDLNPAEAEFLVFKESIRVLKPAEEFRFEEAREHVRNASFYINSGRERSSGEGYERLIESIGLGGIIACINNLEKMEALHNDLKNPTDHSYVN